MKVDGLQISAPRRLDQRFIGGNPNKLAPGEQQRLLLESRLPDIRDTERL